MSDIEAAPIDPATYKVGDRVADPHGGMHATVRDVEWLEHAGVQSLGIDYDDDTDDERGTHRTLSDQVVPLIEAPQDHGPLAAPLSDRTLAKVLSRPAHVPRETPSLVDLDRRDEVRSLLAGAIWISTGGVGNLYDFGHTYAVDPFLAADAIMARFDVRAVRS